MGADRSQRLGLRRPARIRDTRDFKRLREQGRRLSHGSLVANWAPLPPGSESRLGVITAGRIGGAVIRNRARRLMRESFRLHRHEFARPVDLVLVARPSIVGKTYREVETDFLAAARKAGLIAQVGQGGNP